MKIKKCDYCGEVIIDNEYKIDDDFFCERCLFALYPFLEQLKNKSM
jgi:formylmethanofuran dehydrogenase subunit E